MGQLAHLVDDLLEVSRISTGRIRLQQENVDLRGIVERAVESTRPLMDQRRHKLTVTQPREPFGCTPTRFGWNKWWRTYLPTPPNTPTKADKSG